MTLDWKIGGVALGVVFFLAVLLVKPIGVSTQFVILDGIIGDAVNAELVVKTDEGYTSSNAYLAKSNGKYAKAVANPLNYSFVFVVAMLIGGAVSGLARRETMDERRVPAVWAANFGNSVAKRYAGVFIGGFIVIFGARLAGGCSSGHMMSGMMQTSLSGYIFTLGTFAAAFPTALILFRRS
ncbi:YeeE/YedE thiosulfate transporter family protein [Profundibacter sp.]